MGKTSRKMRPTQAVRLEEYDEYDVDYNEYEEADDFAQAQPGILNTPARRIAVLGSLVLLMAILSAAVWILSTRKSDLSLPIAEAPAIGARAPGFDLVDVRTNIPVSLASLRGKPLLVNFWGTWCPPCREEMPVMQEVYSRYRGQVEFVGVSLGPRDSVSSVKDFIGNMGYSWMFLQDDGGNIGTRYQAFQIPTSYFIDPNGVIKAIHIGPMNTQQIEGYLKQAQ